MIYGLSGYFKREKTKKTGCFWSLCRVPSPWHMAKWPQFAVCQAAAHGELTSLCRVPRALAHGEVCCHLVPQPELRRVSHGRHTANLSPSPCAQGPRRTAKFLIFAVCHTASTRRSWPRRRKLRPTPFVTFISPCATNNTWRMCSPCALYLTHGEHSLRRGSGCRRPPTAKFSPCAKWASPCAPGTRRNEEIRWCI